MSQDDFSESFGTYLKRKIVEAGLNQRTAALQIGASSGQMSGWVHGHRRPTPENVSRLAQLLGVPEREMLIRAGYQRRRDTDLHPERAQLLELARELPLRDVPLVTGFVRWRLQEATRPRPATPVDRQDTDSADDPGQSA